MPSRTTSEDGGLWAAVPGAGQTDPTTERSTVEATPAQARYARARATLQTALGTGKNPGDGDLGQSKHKDERVGKLGHRRWEAFHDLLDTQKDLLKHISDLERTLDSVKPYLNGGSGYFNSLGIVQNEGNRIDLLCAKFDLLVHIALQTESDYQEAIGS